MKARTAPPLLSFLFSLVLLVEGLVLFCAWVRRGATSASSDRPCCSSQAQHDRADNCVLRAENDKIRAENIAMMEALKSVICPSCGGPPTHEDSYFDDQKLRMENARLKEEVRSIYLSF